MNNNEKYKLITIILSVIVITLTCTNIYLNLPIPKIEVGMFPYNYLMYSNIVTVGVIGQSNETSPQVSNESIGGTGEGGGSYNVYNFTFQVYNSGKGSAHDVDVMLKGEPIEEFRVISTYVFVDEPLQSNLLDTVQDEYRIGLLGMGKSYFFLFVTEVPANEQGRFVLTVTSENAETRTYQLVFG